MKENILIISASGGGGLLLAAQAKKEEILSKDPKAHIIQKDILLDWVGRPFGTGGMRTWDKAQRKGNIKTLEFIADVQWIADIVFWPQVFYKILRTLFSQDITRVIDTQPICSAAILQAIRIYNSIKKKNLILEKIIVDLPTDLNTHFFRPIKKLGKKNREHIKIFTIEPLVKGDEKKEDFWKRNCNLGPEQVIYQKYLIRTPFKKYQELKPCDNPITLECICHSFQERAMSEKILNKQNMEFIKTSEGMQYFIEKEDKVYTILLGSQPAYNATLSYIEGFHRLAKAATNKTRHIVFAYCAKHTEKSLSLFKVACEWIQQLEPILSNLIIIPVSFQKATQIAPIFYRSNATITRSGGQTAMELLGVMHGKILIHSEIHGDVKEDRLLEGMFRWEAGSAMYLQKIRDAKIVTPQIFEKYLHEYFMC